MNKSLNSMTWSYGWESGNSMGIFLENMSVYSLKGIGSVTFFLIDHWAMIIDIVILLMTNSEMQPFALKNLACCSAAQVLKVMYSSSLMQAASSCSIYHRRYCCSSMSGGSPIVHL